MLAIIDVIRAGHRAMQPFRKLILCSGNCNTNNSLLLSGIANMGSKLFGGMTKSGWCGTKHYK